MMNLFIEDARSFIVFSHNIFFSYFFCHFLFVTSFFSPYFQQIIFLHQFNHLAPRWRVQVLFSPGALFFIQQQFYPKVLSLSLKKTGPCFMMKKQVPAYWSDLRFLISTLDLLRVWSFSSFEWLWENDPDSGSSPWIRVRSWNWPQIRDQHPRFTQGVKFQLIWVT